MTKFQNKSDPDVTRNPFAAPEYFDATTVHADARGFQLADYHPRTRRVFFYPWGEALAPLSTLLAYDTTQSFASAGSYEAVTLTSLLGAGYEGFGAGGFDSDQKWLYMPALRKSNGAGGVIANTLTVRYDTDKPLSSAASWESFDLATLDPVPTRTGWAPCIAKGDYVYYVPVVQYGDPNLLNGVLLRHNVTLPFTVGSSWEWYDLGVNLVTSPTGRARGFQSAAVHGNYLYLIPFGVGESLIVRYDTTASFTTAGSYATFDIATLNANVKGPTGGIVVNDTLVIVPWRNLALTGAAQGMSVSAAYDTTKALDDSSAWEFFDLTTLVAGAKGYQFGWLDRYGYVHFVPSNNFAGGVPPYVAWNSSRPFTSAASWEWFPNTTSPTSTGAAYNTIKNIAWLSPFGSNANSGLITQLDQ